LGGNGRNSDVLLYREAPLYLQLSTEGGAVPQRNAAGALNVVHSFRWWNLKVDSGILTLTRSRPIT
jgi:hypothetical protein